MPEILKGAGLQDQAVTDEELQAMSVREFLRYLRSQEIELRAKEGKLALNAPAGVVTARLQEMIRGRKAQLLEELETQSTLEERAAPLTYAQERLWLVERFSPGTAAYNIPQAWYADGVVDEAIFRKALRGLVNRHASLRTRIELRQGEPTQVVWREVEVPLTVLDLRDVAASEEEATIQTHLFRAGSETFQLDQAPLIRFMLMHLSRGRSLVAYSVHHIVADQRSVDTIRKDLAALYLEALQGTANELPRLALSYAEVAEREHSVAAAKLHAEQLAYWRNRLQGMPMLLELPFSRGSAEAQTYAGATLRLPVDEVLTKELRALAARLRTTLYMTMLSAFAVLLQRYTGQSDVSIGTPLTGRKRREEEDVVGLFINMLPLRCSVDGRLTFAEVTQAISKRVLEDFDNGEVPFQKLVRELHPHRSLTHSPLFQMMFALTPKYAAEDADPLEETFLSISKFDLTMQLAERARSIDMYLEYRTDLFVEADIDQFGKHYVALLREIVKNPESAVESLSWITEEDAALFARWNDTGVEFDRSLTLADLFRAQAHATPDVVALRWKDQQISYAELHQRAERLAVRLRAHGAGPECFIGVCLARTPALMVALLAIHKAGAAYLPLDPKYPLERLKYMLEDSGARLLVAETGEMSDALGAHCPHVIVVAPDAGDVDEAGGARQHATAENAAYLIYTSGSTGKPKGVVVEHRNAVALIAWAKSYLDAEAYADMLASTSVCFDLSVFEIFLPLATGKTVVLMDDVLALASSPIAETVTLVNTVPSAMNALLQAGLPKSVTTVCLAGEFLPTELVDRIYAAGAKQVIDLYGPTETTTYSTCVLREPSATATLGGPLGNTRIYLLNEQQQFVPPGVAGEIYIGGEGVTRGYLGRADLTADKFVSLPEIEPHGRMYRTGDLARRRHDGALLFMGRRDNQVKLRGHRIELGEVEAALREVSDVTEVAVVVREGAETLAAYVESESATPATTRAWGEKLREQLPAYMIPASIVSMAALPRTPNGKIDRQALRRETLSAVMHEEQEEAPQDLLEQWLANIWAQRLKVAKVTRGADFFENLGGHSLVAFEIFAEIEARLGMAMMLATLFQAPTVARLAAAMRRQGWKEPEGLRLAEPWSSSETMDRVVYCIGDSVGIDSRQAGERVMTIADAADHAATARMMLKYEVTQPAIELCGDGTEEARLTLLHDALVHSGVRSVSLRIVK